MWVALLESNVDVLTGILAQVDGVFGESAFLAVSECGFSLNGFETFRIVAAGLAAQSCARIEVVLIGTPVDTVVVAIVVTIVVAHHL